MISLATCKRTSRALKGHLSLLAEIHVSQKRNTSSYDHFMKYGAGGRNSFNGNVATVFGATGFLGRYVVNRLAQTGTQIIVPFRGLDEDIRHLRVMGELGQIVFLEYDIRDEDAVNKAMSHSNVVINLIGRNHATRNFTLEDCHVGAAGTIAKHAAANKVDHLVHVSSLSAKGNSQSKVYRLKAQGERAINENFPNATIIRPAECYGHEDDYLNRYAYLRKLPFGVPLIGGGWETTKRPVYIADVAQGVVNASLDISSKGKTYELYGPEEYYLHDMVDFIFKSIRKPFRSLPVPAALYTAAGSLGEFTIFTPRLTKDMVIRQFLSEEVTDEAHTFEDLNITPVNMNKTALTVLRRHRDYYHHDEIMDETTDVCPPVTAYN